MNRIFAIVLTIIISPLLPVIFSFIYFFIDKKIFFFQKRVGLNGKIFTCFKFASMTNNSKELGDKSADLEIHRINNIGNFIRGTFIDELPQLINIILGQMNFIGPRPHSVYEDLKFVKRITGYKKRYTIKPGITGYAQVNGYNGPIKNINQLKKRIAYDIFYINNMSFLLNLKIFFLTLSILIKKLFNVNGK
ncbi:sugar transferase [Candidatus Pelagibacter bacterium]|nr:sugar transferase [Candidatus Pelagibacter bacterium]